MQLQLVTLQQAKKLKKMGFDWEVIYYYNEFNTEKPVNKKCLGNENIQ